MARTRQLEHRRQLFADEDRNHRSCTDATAATRKANRERVFGRAVRRTEHRSTAARGAQHEVMLFEWIAESLVRNRPNDRARDQRALIAAAIVKHRALCARRHQREPSHGVAELTLVFDALDRATPLLQLLRSRSSGIRLARQRCNLPHRSQRTPITVIRAHLAEVGHTPRLDTANQQPRDHRPHREITIRDVPKRRWRLLENTARDLRKFHAGVAPSLTTPMLTHQHPKGQKNDTPLPTPLNLEGERGGAPTPASHLKPSRRTHPPRPHHSAPNCPHSRRHCSQNFGSQRFLNRRAAEAAEIRGRFWGFAQRADRYVGHDTCESWSWINSQKVAERETPKDFVFRGAAALSGARWALCGLCGSAVKSQGAAKGLSPSSP